VLQKLLSSNNLAPSSYDIIIISDYSPDCTLWEKEALLLQRGQRVCQLKALSDEPNKILWNKASLYDTKTNTPKTKTETKTCKNGPRDVSWPRLKSWELHDHFFLDI